MRKAIAILIVMAMLLLTVGCNPKTKISCDYDINFVEYTDKPDFVEISKSDIILVPLERDFSDNLPHTREQVLDSDSLITVKLNRKPKEINLREYWLRGDGSFINGTNGVYSTTGSFAIDNKKVLLPVINRFDYGIHANRLGSDWTIYKGFEMVITFEDDIVEKYAFITKSEYNYG